MRSVLLVAILSILLGCGGGSSLTQIRGRNTTKRAIVMQVYLDGKHDRTLRVESGQTWNVVFQRGVHYNLLVEFED